MRRLSLNARLAHDEASSAEIEVVLMEISHTALDAPVRLSTDPTERLSIEPLAYGTRSTWRGANPVSDPYFFVLVSVDLPSDIEDAPASANLVLSNVDGSVGELLRTVITPATVSLAVVLASSPDHVEQEWLEMRLVSVEIDAEQVSLSVSRDAVEDEPCPAGKLTRWWFPGAWP